MSAEGTKREDAMGRGGWPLPFLEHYGATFFLETPGLVQKRRTSLTLCCRAHGPLPFWECRTQDMGLVLRFESRLELGNELVKAGFHPTSDLGPTPVLQRGDGDSQFEFDSILGLEVTTAVAADDF